MVSHCRPQFPPRASLYYAQRMHRGFSVLSSLCRKRFFLHSKRLNFEPSQIIKSVISCVGKISAQPHTIVKQICFPNGNVLFLSLFSLSKNWMHNVGWGCAEILPDLKRYEDWRKLFRNFSYRRLMFWLRLSERSISLLTQLTFHV